MEFFCLATGLVAGVLAGLLGVGGGLVIVPALTFIFSTMHFPPAHIAQMAVATSLATIFFTSLSSIFAHQRRHAVDWRIFRRLAPTVFAGTLAGSMIAAHLSSPLLREIFALFLCFAAAQMLFDLGPRPMREEPAKWLFPLAGSAIGFLSALMGIGGGTLTVPLLVYGRLAMHRAIGTSAAVGLPIAIAGVVGFSWAGADDLPAQSLGFIYLPALFFVAAASVFAAPWGAKAAHRLPVPVLRKFFALLLVLVAIKMA